MTQERSIENISLHGGCLCLDFINTVHDWTEPEPHDYLRSYTDLLKWVRRMKLLPSGDIDTLEENSERLADETNQAFVILIKARETLHSLFSSIIHNQFPAEEVRKQFNDLLQKSLSKLNIDFTGANEPVHTWVGCDLEKPLYPVLKSAYDLLMSDKLQRIKACGACGWIFLDKSKNNSRRWCDMQDCGSAVKAKRYYKKKKQKAGKGKSNLNNE